MLRKQNDTMIAKSPIQSYTPFFPPGPVSPTTKRTKPNHFYDEKPRQPDWLLLLICALMLLTVLIAWVVDIPSLFY